MSTNLEQSRQKSIEEMAAINKKEAINKLTQYYTDLEKMYGSNGVSPATLAEVAFSNKKAAGQLDELNQPIAA
jgi:hypothetical protein